MPKLASAFPFNAKQASRNKAAARDFGARLSPAKATTEGSVNPPHSKLFPLRLPCQLTEKRFNRKTPVNVFG
jgi:hypothetical protein